MNQQIIDMVRDNDTYQFDRKNLVSGSTSSGINIPIGGVLLSNNVLAGYVKSNNITKWRIIGKVSENHVNLIPKYNIAQNGGNTKNLQEKEISLKTAVKMLRQYYRTNFN